nr:TNF receptor-associated factor 6-like isoform X1 [Dermacentor andersoni]
MASQDQRYTLCGFTMELDWRPLHFAERIPAHRICSACGVLPRETVFLPCRDVLCRSCYEQCQVDDGYACPLDGDQFLPEEAEWRDFPMENLLRRKVKCWNEERGCDILLAASELTKHFCNDCDHHSMLCPKCSKVVLRSNVAGHLQSKCEDYAMPQTSRALEKSDNDQKAMMAALNTSLNMRVVEMRDRLDALISDHTAQCDRLNEISRCMNTVKEALLQRSSESSTLDRIAIQSTVTITSVREVEETLLDHSEETRFLTGTITDSIKELHDCSEHTWRTVNHLDESNTESRSQADDLITWLTGNSVLIKRTCESVHVLKETFGQVLDDAASTICRKCARRVAGIGEVKDTETEVGPSALNKKREMAFNTINIRRYEFIARKFKEMKESAYLEGIHSYWSEKMYISGYHLSPGVCFRKDGGQVLVHAAFQVHKGVVDEFLQWPFNQSIQLTIKHPLGNNPCQKVANASDNLMHVGRPEESCNKECYSALCFFPSDYLEHHGYVTNDELHIGWELVSNDVAK